MKPKVLLTKCGQVESFLSLSQAKWVSLVRWPGWNLWEDVLGQDVEIRRRKQAKSLHQGRGSEGDPSTSPVDGPVILKVLGEVGPAHFVEEALSGGILPALDNVFQDGKWSLEVDNELEDRME